MGGVPSPEGDAVPNEHEIRLRVRELEAAIARGDDVQAEKSRAELRRLGYRANRTSGNMMGGTNVSYTYR